MRDVLSLGATSLTNLDKLAEELALLEGRREISDARAAYANAQVGAMVKATQSSRSLYAAGGEPVAQSILGDGYGKAVREAGATAKRRRGLNPADEKEMKAHRASFMESLFLGAVAGAAVSACVFAWVTGIGLTTPNQGITGAVAGTLIGAGAAGVTVKAKEMSAKNVFGEVMAQAMAAQVIRDSFPALGRAPDTETKT